MFSILWFLYNVLEPYGLKVVSQLIAGVSVAGLIVTPLWKLGKFFYVPGRLDQVKWGRFQTTLGIVALVAAAIFLIPLPYHVISTLEIKPRDAQSVYVSIPGTLKSIEVKPGQAVAAGQLLAQLSNVDLDMEIADLEGQASEHESRLKSLQRIRLEDPTAGLEVPQALDLLTSVKRQLNQKLEDRKRLELRAPVAGTVLPPPELPKRPTSEDLQNWHGLPLDKRNLGALLTESTLFCQIGDPRKMEASLVIDQEDIEHVKEGQTIDIKLNELPGRTFRSAIEKIGPALKAAPRQLSSKTGGELATQTDEGGVERPMSTSYPARAPLDDEDGLMFIGLRGRAKVHASWETLGRRSWRLFIRTFNFKL